MSKVIYILFFLMVGCASKDEDISHYAEYANIIGKTYKTLEPLKIHGVTRDKIKVPTTYLKSGDKRAEKMVF